MITPTTAHTIWRFRTPLQRTCRVVFAGPHFQAGLPNTIDELRQRFPATRMEIIHAPTREKLMEVAPDVDVALPFMERFDAEFIRSATNLRLIQQFGVGLEGVDISEATRHGIAVSNVPADGTGNAQATSEHALFLAISLLRHAKEQLQHRFQSSILGGLPIPQCLYRKRVTVLGYGHVGATLCRYLHTMGADVTAIRRQPWTLSNDPNHHLPDIHRSNSLEEALPNTHVLILTCVVNSETRHIINEKSLQLLPPGSFVVNVARGPLVEYNAMLQALNSGHVAGFASDVGISHPSKPSEPWDPNDPISTHPNAYFTPHVGGYCDMSYQAMARIVLDEIDRVIDGRGPKVWVNRDRIQ